MNELEDFEFQLSAEKKFSGGGTSGEKGGGARTYVDPSDGTVYEWDDSKQGWFPKIDDDFLAAYQASYGVDQPTGPPSTVAATSGESSASAPVTTEAGGRAVGIGGTHDTGPADGDKNNGATSENSRKRKQEEHDSGWFEMDNEHNHNVYVSGLPLDTTLEEFQEIMSKYGIIMEDENGELKLKLYTDVNGKLKGDGRCCYLKIESVKLALEILDGSSVRGHTIHVERAHFQMKGEYNPSLKKKKKKKKGRGQEKLLDWRERAAADAPKRNKYDKIVIFKHLFDPKEFEDEATLINDIRDDLREECEKFGVVKKVLLFDRHPEGVGSVAFKDHESADMCVSKMHGRWYGGRKLEVIAWDGVTNYQVEETHQEREARLKQWEEFLEAGTEEQPANPEAATVSS